MKNRIINYLSIAAILTIGFTARAQDSTGSQTNVMPSFSSGLQMIYDSVSGSTNYGVAFGGGRSLTGQRNLAFGEVLYNFTPSVGFIAGYDYLWASKHLGQPSQANLVKGGVNLQADLHPFKNLGWTNATVTPFGFALVATGNGMVSEIVGAGGRIKFASFNLGPVKDLNLGGGAFYEKRTGAGFWDGNYACGFLDLSKGF